MSGLEASTLECPWCRKEGANAQVSRPYLRSHLAAHDMMLRMRPGWEQAVTQKDLEEVYQLSMRLASR